MSKSDLTTERQRPDPDVSLSIPLDMARFCVGCNAVWYAAGSACPTCLSEHYVWLRTWLDKEGQP